MLERSNETGYKEVSSAAGDPRHLVEGATCPLSFHSTGGGRWGGQDPFSCNLFASSLAVKVGKAPYLDLKP